MNGIRQKVVTAALDDSTKVASNNNNKNNRHIASTSYCFCHFNSCGVKAQISSQALHLNVKP